MYSWVQKYPNYFNDNIVKSFKHVYHAKGKLAEIFNWIKLNNTKASIELGNKIRTFLKLLKISQYKAILKTADTKT